MSTPILSLALVTMCALFSAAAADTAQVLGLRNQAADEARRVATVTLDACAVNDSAQQQCALPPGCAAPACTMCRRGDSVRADVALDWSPVLLRGLTPARGRHVLSLEALDVTRLTGARLPRCR